jgi:histidinol-phosphate aminotransferase
MGLLDYYRQFDDLDEEVINRGLRERRAKERALALERVPKVDLSSAEWPDFPNSEIVNASIAAARGRVNGYPDRHATAVREALAKRHDVQPEQIVVGNGASELLQLATMVLLEGGELISPWPSYPLYPLMAQRAGGRPVAVEPTPEAIRAAVNDRTRLVVLCNPNDPTGTYMRSTDVAELIGSLPDHVHVLLDEAFIQFEDVEPVDSCLRLVDAFPRLLVFRTFSKIYGLSGLRAGYAVGSTASGDVLSALAPALGISVLTQAGVAQALKIGDAEIERRRALVIEQRTRLLRALHDLPVDAPDSQANFVWLHAAGLSGAQLTGALEKAGVIVAPGGPLGADDHVRASIRGAAATDLLLAALAAATAG